MRFRGAFNNSNSYPTGNIKAGDVYLLTNDSVINGRSVTAGKYLVARVDNPSVIHVNWSETAGYIPEDISNKNMIDGYAGLDSNGKINLSQMPITGLSYRGVWDASTAFSVTSPLAGDYYYISVAGTTSVNGISDWQPGDWIIYNGINWSKIDNSDTVKSVNGYTGNVNLQLSDLGVTGLNSIPGVMFV